MRGSGFYQRRFAMGLIGFIFDTLIEYSASQGDAKAIDIIRRRDELREKKRQKKAAKKRHFDWLYLEEGSATARLDDPYDTDPDDD